MKYKHRLRYQRGRRHRPFHRPSHAPGAGPTNSHRARTAALAAVRGCGAQSLLQFERKTRIRLGIGSLTPPPPGKSHRKLTGRRRGTGPTAASQRRRDAGKGEDASAATLGKRQGKGDESGAGDRQTHRHPPHQPRVRGHPPPPPAPTAGGRGPTAHAQAAALPRPGAVLGRGVGWGSRPPVGPRAQRPGPAGARPPFRGRQWAVVGPKAGSRGSPVSEGCSLLPPPPPPSGEAGSVPQRWLPFSFLLPRFHGAALGRARAAAGGKEQPPS